MPSLPELTIVRNFSAPVANVWQAWTDPGLLQQWYGPGVETIIHEFNAIPGGVWLNEMKFGGGSDYQKATFIEVNPPQQLVWHHCSTDAEWNVVTNPMMPDWPRVLLTTVTFKPVGDLTEVTFSQVPHEATEAEIACFAGAMNGMAGGWGKGFEVIDTLLKQMQG